MFTWGRGDYGQLGRQILMKQHPDRQSAGHSAGGGNQESCTPAEVEVLHGVTHVRLVIV